MISGMPRIAIATNDFEGIVAMFRDVFGMPVIDLSDSSVDNLGARLGMCVPPGGSNIELMSPANPNTPLSQSLERFLDRRGEGLFALMLEAATPNDEADVLLGRGLNVLPLMEGAGGRDIHPNSTQGVLIRIYPDGSFTDTQSETDKSLGLSGVSKVMIAVNDIRRSSVIYGEKMRLASDPVQSTDGRGVASVKCYPPTGGIIELVSPQDTSIAFAQSIREHLDTRGEGMYALVLKAPVIATVSDHLTSRGLDVVTFEDDFLKTTVIETEVFGARVCVEEI